MKEAEEKTSGLANKKERMWEGLGTPPTWCPSLMSLHAAEQQHTDESETKCTHIPLLGYPEHALCNLQAGTHRYHVTHLCTKGKNWNEKEEEKRGAARMTQHWLRQTQVFPEILNKPVLNKDPINFTCVYF